MITALNHYLESCSESQSDGCDVMIRVGCLLLNLLLKPANDVTALEATGFNITAHSNSFKLSIHLIFHCQHREKDLGVDIGVLAVADHLGALGHVFGQGVLVRLEERHDRVLQDPGEHLDLLGCRRYACDFTLKIKTNVKT